MMRCRIEEQYIALKKLEMPFQDRDRRLERENRQSPGTLQVQGMFSLLDWHDVQGYYIRIASSHLFISRLTARLILYRD